ncbi:MAG: gliding motility-associated C-terminal domain-containing protein [Bacteroidia bacterium]|nr:gliding motility-associated C-terminal domain-containing protein [Bacteroidia bacterium]
MMKHYFDYPKGMHDSIWKILFLAIFLIGSLQGFSQSTSVQRQAKFESLNQNMWGPGGALFQLNINQELFRLDWDENTSIGGITTILGSQFGARLSASTWGDIGARFYLDSLTTGDVSVKYPIRVTYDIPANGNIDKGSLVRINTSYDVENGWELSTNHPFPGRMGMDFWFGMGINVELAICVFSCLNIPVIPNISLPVQTINIFQLSPSQAQILGPVIPFTNDLCTSGICVPGTVIFGQPAITIPDNKFGISGSLIMPYTPTTDRLGADKCLYAEGDSVYITLSLDILGFVSNFIPPPAGPIIGSLSNTFTLPSPFGNVYGASIWYNIFTASFDVVNNHIQEFAFKPTVYTRMDLPLPLDYQVINPNSGTVISSGTDSSVTFVVGNSLELRFPCHYENLEVSPTLGLRNTFANNTYDQIEFSLAFSALEVGFDLPPITIVPRICFPEICLNIPYPCPTWSKPWRWCSSRQCTPAFCTPAVRFGGISFGIGPLWEETIPLGALGPITWFNDSWEMTGFRDTSVAPFQLFSRPYTASMDSVPIACFGDSTGQLNLSILNGITPFSLAWSDGSNTSSNTRTISQGGLPAGPQFVTVTDANGCATLASTYVTEPVSALEVLEELPQNVLCNGQANGSIDMTLTGGTTPYTFAWSNGATTEDLSNLTAGSYSVTVTDGNGCIITETIEISEPTVTTVQSLSTPVNCFGGQDGSLDVSVNGGTEPYSYSWSNGASTQDLQSVAAGIYDLTITDGNGCITQQSFQVVEPLAPVSLTSILNEPTCYGSTNGSISVNTAGGTAPYSYQWITGSNTVLSADSANIQNIGSNTYRLIITDANNCVFTDSFAINQPDSIALEALATDVNCFGQSTGSIQITNNGGTQPYTYLWSNGATSRNLNNIQAGSYQLTLTDGNGCSKSISSVIVQPDTSIYVEFQTQAVSCFGGQDGSISLNAFGGTAPYSYAWSNGSGSANQSNLASGTYTVTITDAKGCMFVESISITQPPSPITAQELITAVSCFEGGDGSISIQTNGGTAPYSYQWTDSDGQVFNPDNSSINSLRAGTYFLRITDAKACSLEESYVVTQPDSIRMIVNSSDISCFNGNDGSIQTFATGGNQPYTYSWNNGSTASNLSLLAAGTYELTLTDSKGCSKESSITLNQPATAVLAEASKVDVSCFQGNDGRADVLANGGTAPYSYQWSRGDTDSYMADVSAGTYTVVVTDANGCTAQSGVVIDQPQSALLASFSEQEDVSCFGGSDGSLSVSISGGVTPYTFQWADSLIQLSNPVEKLEGLRAGIYQARVEDGSGCVVEIDVRINQPELLTASLEKTNANCAEANDGSITVSVSGGTTPYSFIWEDGAFSQNRDGLNKGTYTVLISDDNDCTTSLETTIEAPDSLIIRLTASSISCREETDGSAQVFVSGGTKSYEFEWSNGENVEKIEDLAPGAYQVIVRDENGCTAEGSIVVPGSNEPCFFIPNAFTPNGDGKNDSWNIPYASQYPDMEFQIFNQWGMKLFQGSISDLPWNGMVNGKLLPAATYYYIMDLKNGEEPFNGPLTIVR